MDYRTSKLRPLVPRNVRDGAVQNPQASNCQRDDKRAGDDTTEFVVDDDTQLLYQGFAFFFPHRL